MTRRKYWVFCSLLSLALLIPSSEAARRRTKSSDTQRDTVAKPLSEKERRKREEKLRKELEGPYRKWLSEDVSYIITDEERGAFKRLATDDEREQFIEQFWLRRDPTPDSAENEFKEEHYRRIAYANERFASGIPGWKSDRGRIYIMYGPPDENDSHPSGGAYDRPFEEGGGTTSTFPFEIWRYRYIEDIGTDVLIEFVDPTLTGEYRMTMDPSEKDALLYVPNAGLTLNEQMGLSDKADRFSRTDGTRLGIGDQPTSMRMNQFERLERFAKLQKPPSIKFKDLEAAVTSKVTYNLLPIKVRADFVRVTSSSVLTNITVLIDKKDLQFQEKEGIQKAIVNIYGRVTSMARRVVNVFEDPVTIDVPSELLQEAIKGKSIYGKSVPLAPGMYRLNIVAKDVTGGNMNNYEMALKVPTYDDETLSSSSVILADKIEKVPTRSIGSGQFVIGTSKVRPRVDDAFSKEEKMGVYVQFYNFKPDEKTHKPNGLIEYEVVKDGTNERIFEFKEEINSIEGASASQVTVEKVLPLQSLSPGRYTIKMKVLDRNKDATLTTAANFTVS